MTMNDEDRPDETRVRPVAEDELWTPDSPEAEKEDIQPIDIRAKQRKVIAIGLGCALVAACGLGAAAWATRPTTQPAEEGPVAEEPAVQDASVPQLLTSLSYHGRDVSATPSALTVTAAHGHVMVEERSDADAATRVDLSARRSAALAHELSGQTVRGDEVADVTWVACDPGGAVKFAVKNDVSSDAANAAEYGDANPGDGESPATPSDGAQDASKTGEGDTASGGHSEPSDGGEAKDDEPTTSEVVSGSTGWTMSGDTKDGLADVAPDLPQQGGEVPTTPDGAEIAPEQPAPAEPSEEIPAEGGEGAGPGNPGQSSQPASGTPSGSAGGSTASTPSAPAGAGSSSSGSSGTASAPAHQHDWQPVYGTRWVQDSAAWDETVVVSAAWDEPIYEVVWKYRCTWCGTFFDSLASFTDHNDSEHDSEASFNNVKQNVQTGTKHHDAVTKVVHHDATGHNESYVTGYRCSGCGATK